MDTETRYGKYTTLFSSPSLVITLQYFKPESSTPIQKHTKSSIFVYVLKGVMKLSFGPFGKHVYICEDDSWKVRKNEPFQFTNTEKTILVFLEVQRGDVAVEPEIDNFKEEHRG